jgi:XisI protein
MDTNALNHWRRTIKKILTDVAAIPFPEVVTMCAKTVFDDAADVYVVLVEGWQDVRRLHGCLVHVEIKGDKIWVQQDGTEDGVVADLLAAGIPKDSIVLGFKSPQTRALTPFAVA